MKKALILGKVWPEPGSSAAGTRLLQLMDILREDGYLLYFASPAQPGEHSFDPIRLNVEAQVLPINDAEADNYLKNLMPELVIFDRFTTEEQFGWRVTACCPNSLRILDTEDLHCLRLVRQKAIKSGRDFKLTDLLRSDVARREIASIFRCDLSLIISKAELKILKDIFRVDDSLLHYIPMFVNRTEITSLPGFDSRTHFVSIGNFLHDPNRDSVTQLHEKIWPLIRKALPEAEVHVYGAYADDQIFRLHDEKKGFVIKGRAANVNDVFRSAKVCLAYLRFGAGLKGKLLDAMTAGTPSATTPVGIEGLGEKNIWPGIVEEDTEKFAASAVELYNDKNVWQQKQNNIPALVAEFDKDHHARLMMEKIRFLLHDLETHRTSNFIGAMLHHHTAQSTKYMSLWIESKNKLASLKKPQS